MQGGMRPRHVFLLAVPGTHPFHRSLAAIRGQAPSVITTNGMTCNRPRCGRGNQLPRVVWVCSVTPWASFVSMTAALHRVKPCFTTPLTIRKTSDGISNRFSDHNSTAEQFTHPSSYLMTSSRRAWAINDANPSSHGCNMGSRSSASLAGATRARLPDA